MEDLAHNPVDPVSPAPQQAAPKAPKRERHRGHPALGFVVNSILGLPLLVQLPIYILAFVFYSPPAVLNLWNCVRAIRSKEQQRLRVISGPEFLFLYPLIAWGYVAWAVTVLEWVPQPVTCWLYLALVVYTLITIGLDFKSTGWFGTGIVVIALLAILGWWASANDIPYLEIIGHFFAWFGLREFPASLVFAISSFLAFVYLIMFIHMNLYNVLRVDGNYVQVWNFLGSSPKDTRATFTLVPGNDDVNELCLNFAIPVELKSKSPRVKSHSFENVPGGPVVEQVVTALLNAQEVRSLEPNFDNGESEDDDA
ncbi:MAG: hypothetical protein KDD69_16225 [Bdellovibrionales bacterium]|nr:hypothetical protein [Bdellovibrionales bacterium]